MATYFLSQDVGSESAKAIERKLRSVIPDVVKLGGMDDIVATISAKAREKCTILVVVSPKDGGAFARWIDLAEHHRDRAYFILISDDIAASNYKRLVRTGGGDWVSANAVPHEVIDIITRQRTGAQPRSARHTDPVVVCFAPSAGGVGNTTLATEVAVHLKSNKSTRDRRICIVDLDFQSSHVCDLLDIEPRLQIQEISNSPERLDEQLFDIFISRHASGLHVFAAPRSKFDFCEVSTEALDSLFEMISSRYDLVFIDIPVSWFKWTFHVISASDAVIVTGTNTIPVLRQMAETVTAVRDLRRVSAQFAMVVNRCERRMLGGVGRRHHVEKVLGRENVFFIGEDPMIVQAANAGTPMVQSDAGRKTSKEIASLATFCAAVKSTRSAAV
jgi:pilus assembly protein CpaE